MDDGRCALSCALRITMCLNTSAALAIDPFDSDHLLYGTGATLYGSRDLTKVRCLLTSQRRNLKADFESTI